MSRAKNQHWVPQFYLRHFATPETSGQDHPQVWIFSTDEGDGDETLTNVRNICAKRYLYSPVSESGERVWDLDTELEILEAAIGGLWPMLATSYPDLGDPSLRKGVSLFVAVMHLRHPDILKAVEEIHQRLVAFYEDVPKKPDGAPDVDSVEMAGVTYSLNLSDWNAYRAWGRDDHHRFFTHLVRREANHLARILMEKRWSMIVADSDAFVTTDKPVGLKHQTRPVFGLRTPGVIVSFPVSPTRLLVMDDMHHEPANQFYPLKPSMSGAFNYHIWTSGSRFMISGRSIPEVLAELVTWTDLLDTEDA